MTKLGKVEINDEVIREVSPDGHAGITIQLDEVTEIEFVHGIIAEHPLVQLVIIFFLVPVILWSVQMLFHDFEYDFPTGNMRPATCGCLAIGLSILVLQLSLQFIRQPHLHVKTNKGARKLRIGKGVDSAEIKTFCDQQRHTLKCRVVDSM